MIGKSLRKDLTVQQKTTANKYNDWLKNIYKKKDPQQQKDILKQLSDCNTFSGLNNVINKNQ